MQTRVRRKGAAGVEVQMACIDLLILLEGIGPRPNALHHVLPKVRRGAAHCGQVPWHKGSREAVGRRERDAAATVAGNTREQENSCFAAIELAHT